MTCVRVAHHPSIVSDIIPFLLALDNLLGEGEEWGVCVCLRIDTPTMSNTHAMLIMPIVSMPTDSKKVEAILLETKTMLPWQVLVNSFSLFLLCSLTFVLSSFPTNRHNIYIVIPSFTLLFLYPSHFKTHFILSITHPQPYTTETDPTPPKLQYRNFWTTPFQAKVRSFVPGGMLFIFYPLKWAAFVLQLFLVSFLTFSWTMVLLKVRSISLPSLLFSPSLPPLHFQPFWLLKNFNQHLLLPFNSNNNSAPSIWDLPVFFSRHAKQERELSNCMNVFMCTMGERKRWWVM